MKSTLERAPGSRVILEIEVSPEEMEPEIQEACRRLSRQVRIPGYRPGKAPSSVVQRVLGRQRALQEALDPMVTRAYRTALEEEGVSAVEAPQIEVKSFEDGTPLQFVATVAVQPEVTLAEFPAERIRPEPPTVGPEDVDQAVEALREQRAIWVPKTEASAVGDLVMLRTTGRVIDGPRIEERSVEGVLGSGQLRPQIDEAVTGAVPGAVVELDLEFGPEERVAAVRGKSAHVRVELLEVKRRELPELDDAFAAEVAEGKTLAELRADVGNRLRAAWAQRAHDAATQQALERVVAEATVELPAVLIDRAVDSLLGDMANQLQRAGVGLEEAVARDGKTVEQLRAELRPEGERRARTLLVLEAVARREGLTVSDGEVEQEIAQLAAQGGLSLENLRRAVRRSDGGAGIRLELLRRKAVAVLRRTLVEPLPVEGTDGADSGSPAAGEGVGGAEGTGQRGSEQ